VTRREADDRHAVTLAELTLQVTITPSLEPDELTRLLAKSERDCFIGASLASPPTYHWTVNGVVQSAHA
jgi:uncharacterized OsmC-like protein